MFSKKLPDRLNPLPLLLAAIGFHLAVWCPATHAVAKVFLKNGETRLGKVLVRDGRVTIKAVDRLFQHPEEAVHRIDHVSGETALVASDNVRVSEKPEPFSKHTAYIPKGCEVNIIGHEGSWTKIEVYSGRDKVTGYIHDDDLADTVVLAPIDPRVRFKDPPRNLRDRFREPPIDRTKKRNRRLRIEDLVGLQNETSFNELLSQRLYGKNLDQLMLDMKQKKAGRKKKSGLDEDLSRKPAQQSDP